MLGVERHQLPAHGVPAVRTATLVIMAAGLLSVVLWDVVVASNKTSDDTVSEISLGFLRRYPIAGLAIFTALGIVLGHLTWPQCGTCP